MADLAEVGDVEEDWRALTAAERTVALSELRGGSADIRLGIAEIDDLLEAEALAGGLTPKTDKVRATLVHAVRRFLKASSRTDPTQYGGPLITRAELDDLRSYVTGEGDAAVVPVGAFPVVCDYPVY